MLCRRLRQQHSAGAQQQQGCVGARGSLTNLMRVWPTRHRDALLRCIYRWTRHTRRHQHGGNNNASDRQSVRVVTNAVRLAAKALFYNPRELAGQLVGQCGVMPSYSQMPASFCCFTHYL